MSHASVLVAVDGPEEKIEEQVAFEMGPFYENDECFRDGSRWDWYAIGGRWEGRLLGQDVIQKKRLNLDAMLKQRKSSLTENFNEAHEKGGEHMDFIFGVKPDETLDEYLKRKLPSKEAALSFYAFLHNRHWHEAERMGWFGTRIKTECEIKNPDHPLDNSKCIVKDEKTGARIINWQEPDEVWDSRFYQRFIEPLPPNKFLVVVDFHV